MYIFKNIFVLISHSVINKGALRLRTKAMLTLNSSLFAFGVIFLILGLLKASERVGGIVVLTSMFLPYLIGKFIDSYVENNWYLFNYRSKNLLKHRLAKVLLAWVLFFTNILFLVLCFYWFLKNTV